MRKRKKKIIACNNTKKLKLFECNAIISLLFRNNTKKLKPNSM